MAIAPLLAIGGGLIQGVSAIQQGNAQAAYARAQGQTQADELARDAQMTKIAADQSNASRLDELRRTVGNINATVAGRGLSASSPSAMALVSGADTYAMRDVARAAFNSQQQIGADQLGAKTAQSVASFKAKVAQQAGYMSAASSLFKAASTANSLYGK